MDSKTQQTQLSLSTTPSTTTIASNNSYKNHIIKRNSEPNIQRPAAQTKQLETPNKLVYKRVFISKLYFYLYNKFLKYSFYSIP